MSPAALELDFLGPREDIPVAAMLLLLLGVGTLLWAVIAWRMAYGEAAGLQLKLEERSAVSAHAHQPTISPALAASAATAAARLATPWPQMLGDLEAAGLASKGDVAVLAIAPDRIVGKVQVIAEARSLTAALAYVQRLQQNPAVRNAVLNSHELRSDQPSHPVRFQMTADWHQATQQQAPRGQAT